MARYEQHFFYEYMRNKSEMANVKQIQPGLCIVQIGAVLRTSLVKTVRETQNHLRTASTVGAAGPGASDTELKWTF